MTLLTLLTLGGLWRVIDGEPWVPKFVRQAGLLGILSYGCMYYSLPLWASLYIIVLVWINIEMGFKDWTKFKYMWSHYSKYSLLTLNPLYVLMSIVAGLSYPVLAWLEMPKYDFYARFVSGALVIGLAPVAMRQTIDAVLKFIN